MTRAPEITFGTNFKIGVACLLMGILALLFSAQKRQTEYDPAFYASLQFSCAKVILF